MLLNSSIQVLFLGSIYTLSRKYQNLQISTGLDGRSMRFHHPLYFINFNFRFQVFCLFLGMALCLPFKYCTSQKKSEKKQIQSYVMIIPALCDVLATIFDATGLIYVSIINIIMN